MTDVGVPGWKQGLKAREPKLETARRALREVPPPKRSTINVKTLAEAYAQDLRDFYGRVIAEVRVYPRASGDRLMMRWQGSEECFPVPEFDPTPPPGAEAGLISPSAQS